VGGYVYIMTNRRHGVLYIGVAADIGARVSDHKTGQGSLFCKRYGLRTLVWYEHHGRIEDAIQRETSLKRWPRRWKIELIERTNPGWEEMVA
jgi:putative endonuclease